MLVFYRMKILLHKISDERHALEVGGERVELETKSVLHHDFLHFAVESEAGLQDGFWGALAAGKTLTDMGDRTGEAMKDYSASMPMIEKIVGAMSMAMKGRTAAQMIEGFRMYAEAQGESLPLWLTEDLIVRVQERMRKLIGHWNSTPFGGSMELDWS